MIDKYRHKGYTVRLMARNQAGVLQTYVIEWTCPGNKRRYRHSLRTLDTDEAERKFRLFIERRLPGLIAGDEAEQSPQGQPVDPRVIELIRWYVDVHLSHMGRAERTQHKYSALLDEFAAFCRQRHIGRASQINWAGIEAFLAWRGPCADKTRAGLLQILRGWLNACVDAGMLAGSPVRKWLVPSVAEPEPVAWTVDELHDILATIAEKCSEIYPPCLFMALTGVRVGDALDLRWRQVRWDENRIRRTQIKTGWLAYYPLAPAVRAVLESESKRAGRPGGDAHVFLNGSEPLTYNALYRRFTRALGDGHTLKAFRTTFGTLMAMRGVNPRVLQTLMGHRDLQTTLRYYVAVSDGDALAAVVGLGEALA